jgi:hypothetical protein
VSRISAKPNKALKSLISFAGTARRHPLAYSLVSVRYGSKAAILRRRIKLASSNPNDGLPANVGPLPPIDLYP